MFFDKSASLAVIYRDRLDIFLGNVAAQSFTFPSGLYQFLEVINAAQLIQELTTFLSTLPELGDVVVVLAPEVTFIQIILGNDTAQIVGLEKEFFANVPISESKLAKVALGDPEKTTLVAVNQDLLDVLLSSFHSVKANVAVICPGGVWPSLVFPIQQADAQTVLADHVMQRKSNLISSKQAEAVSAPEVSSQPASPSPVVSQNVVTESAERKPIRVYILAFIFFLLMCILAFVLIKSDYFSNGP